MYACMLKMKESGDLYIIGFSKNKPRESVTEGSETYSVPLSTLNSTVLFLKIKDDLKIYFQK